MLWKLSKQQQGQRTLWRLFSLLGIIILAATALNLVLPEGAQAMLGLFKRYDVEMSSPVHGRVTNKGEPLAGLTVYRSLVYQGYKKGEEQLHSTQTDSDGRFSFPEMMVKSRYPGDLFGANFGVQQSVYIEIDDELYCLWSSRKIPEMRFPKLSELLQQLECDLQNKEVKYKFYTHIDTEEYPVRHHVYSICRWKDEGLSVSYKGHSLSSFSDIEKIDLMED